MNDIWQGSGVWSGWKLTTDHSASSYNQPVLVNPDGEALGPGDIDRTAVLDQVTTVTGYSLSTGINIRTVQRMCESGKLTAKYEHGVWLILKDAHS